VIEINKAALKENIKFIKKIAGKTTSLSSVVKGNAYGHGFSPFVPLAVDCGVNHFSVFSADEAYQVKKVVNEEATVLIMGMMERSQVEWAVRNGVEFYVFDISRLKAAVSASIKTGKRAIVHIEVETGLNRTGFNFEELKTGVKLLKDHPENLEFKGLCTHFAGAECISNYFRIMSQLKVFRKMHKYLLENGLNPQVLHTACSAAAVRYPSTRMDMVRIGIMQYGFWPNTETYISYMAKKEKRIDPLKRILSWKSRVMCVKEVKTGEFVGYGTSFLASKNMKIAMVPVGYSHGFSRSLSNHGRVLVRGERVSVIGTVTMNSFTIDVTDVDGISAGDEVVLIGDQGDLSISVSSFSEMSSQLNYELLTRLPENIRRIVI
jgi:alanine racemase